jgi:hypothetical protein
MAAAREKFVIDLDNVEDLFGLVEISHRLGESRPQTRSDVIYLIAKTLALSIAQPPRPRPKLAFGLSSVPAPLQRLADRQNGSFREVNQHEFTADMYDYFAALAAGLFDDPRERANRKDTIITFNYDLVCDDALRRVGFAPNYHLPQQAKDTRDAGDSQPSVDVLKLHGSTNWAFCQGCQGISVLEGKLTEDPQRLRNLRCCEKVAGEFLLVPPSWDKTEYREIIKSVWSRAVEELKAATRICVIGYSMPEVDAFFRYLLTLALAKNDHLYKLIVVDRNPTIERRYKKVLDHTFIKRRFEFPGRAAAEFGVTQFLGSLGSLKLLGRAELVVRYLNWLPEI